MLRIEEKKIASPAIRSASFFQGFFLPCQKQLLLMGFSSFSAPTNERFSPLNRPIFFSPSRITEGRFFSIRYTYIPYVPNILLPFWQKGGLGLCGEGGGDFSRKIRKRLREKEKEEEEEAPSRTRKVGKQSPTKRKGKRFAHKNNVWKFS